MPDFAKQSEYTDASTVARKFQAQTVNGMAHFAGTGPDGTVCGGCLHWLNDHPRKKPICQKFKRMTGDGAKPIPHSTPSCRHFEVRPRA